jgi:hypothetical protein
MDWFTAWEPAGYVEIEIERGDAPTDSGMLTAWLILAVIALAVIALAGLIAWYRQRVVRRSFWCATAGRDVEVRFRRACVLSCSVFEEPTAAACARRCLDGGFRAQWPPALPVIVRRLASGRVA